MVRERQADRLSLARSMAEGPMNAKSAVLARAGEALGEEGSMAVSKHGKDKQGIVASSSSSKSSSPGKGLEGGGRAVQEEPADPVDAASSLLQAVMRQHERLQTGYGSNQAGVGQLGRNGREGAGVDEVFWGEREEEEGGGDGASVPGQSRAGRDAAAPSSGRELPNEVCFTCLRCGELFENSGDDQEEDVCCKVPAPDIHSHILSDFHKCGHCGAPNTTTWMLIALRPFHKQRPKP